MARERIQQFSVRSGSSRNTFYKVTLYRDAANSWWECSCPAWTRNFPRVDCKHIRQTRATFYDATPEKDRPYGDYGRVPQFDRDAPSQPVPAPSPAPSPAPTPASARTPGQPRVGLVAPDVPVTTSHRMRRLVKRG